MGKNIVLRFREDREHVLCVHKKVRGESKRLLLFYVYTCMIFVKKIMDS